MFLVPVIFLVAHAFWFLGWRRGLIFILIPALTGAIFELIGLKYGVIFGGHYVYKPQTFMLWGLPLIVPIYWSVFIYFSYWLTNSFLIWLNRSLPSYKQPNLLLMFLLIILDGLIVTSIDIPMDPIAVTRGDWTWIGGGEYFGIPIGNFFGWFLVATISSVILRSLDFRFPRMPKLSKNIHLLPVIGYSLLSLSLTLSAINLNLPVVALIAIISMTPIILANLLVYAYSK